MTRAGSPLPLSAEEYRFGHRVYSAAELRQVLKQAGFSQVTAYGELGDAPYDHQARRLVVVAAKA
ncbi:MAG: hypothetical protein AB1609_07400 [Bacillota bacterium]